ILHWSWLRIFQENNRSRKAAIFASKSIRRRMLNCGDHPVALSSECQSSETLEEKMRYSLSSRRKEKMCQSRLRRACVHLDRPSRTVLQRDEPLVALAAGLGIRCFRGSECDVLDRFVGAAQAFNADVVVRLTADCPLLDGAVIDRVVKVFQKTAVMDYVSNTLNRTYPPRSGDPSSSGLTLTS